MNNFFWIVAILAFSSVGSVLQKPDKEEFLDKQKIYDVPSVLWKIYDVLSAHPSCKDLKIIAVPAQVHMRQKKIFVRAEVPKVVGSRLEQAQLRLEFRGLRDAGNGSEYRADIGGKDARIRGARSREAQDAVVMGSDEEMSFDVTDLLRPNVQLRRKHFSAHLNITPANRLLKAESLKVFLIIQQKDTTCSDFSLPNLRGGITLPLHLPNNVSISNATTTDPLPQCRSERRVVSARDVPVSFNVLRPEAIDIGSCGGLCDLAPGRALFSNHAALKALLHEKAGEVKNWVSPCCAPSGFRPVLMMGQEPFSNYVSILEVPNMRISSCACM